MDILIKNMELPKDTGSVTVTIYSDGSTGIWTEQEMIPGGMAIELPPHGDLVEISKAREALRIHGQASPWYRYVPVIVEATE